MPPDRLTLLCRRAIRHFRSGNAQRWVACLAARRIVGHYDEGATAALASDLCLSITQIHSLADAGRAYITYRKLTHNCQPLRLRLTPSHFAAIWQLQARYGFADFEAIGYLSEAAEYGASVASMRVSVDGIYSTKPVAFKVEGTIDDVLDWYDSDGRKTLITISCRDCSNAPEVGSAVRIVQRTESKVKA